MAKAILFIVNLQQCCGTGTVTFCLIGSSHRHSIKLCIWFPSVNIFSFTFYNRNRNLSKVGTGTVIYSYGSASLITVFYLYWYIYAQSWGSSMGWSEPSTPYPDLATPHLELAMPHLSSLFFQEGVMSWDQYFFKFLKSEISTYGSHNLWLPFCRAY